MSSVSFTFYSGIFRRLDRPADMSLETRLAGIGSRALRTGICLTGTLRRPNLSISWGGYLGLRDIREFENEWAALAKDLADFGEGVVVCSRTVVPDDGRPQCWYIGPEKSVLQVRIDALELEESRLAAARRKLCAAVGTAGMHVIDTKPPEAG
jgi:hypothetical protein